MGRKNHKTHWYEAVSFALNFPFLQDVLQSCFIFDVVNFKKRWSLAELCRFGAMSFRFFEKSRRPVSFLMLSTSKTEEFSLNFVVLELWTSIFEKVSQTCFVFNVVNFTKWWSLAEFRRCELSFFEKVSQTCFFFGVVNFKNRCCLAEFRRFGAVNFPFLRKSRRLASFWSWAMSSLHCSKFCAAGFFLTRQKHRNQCTDVQSRTGLYLNTDHYIVEMKTRITLAATSQPGLSTPKFLQPNLTQWQRYNESVSSLYALTSHAAEPWKRFNDVMSSAANQCLSKADSRSKKDYISRGTWNLINRRQTFFSEGDREEVTSY